MLFETAMRNLLVSQSYSNASGNSPPTLKKHHNHYLDKLPAKPAQNTTGAIITPYKPLNFYEPRKPESTPSIAHTSPLSLTFAHLKTRPTVQ